MVVQTNKWLEERNIDVRISDYSEASVLSILDSSNAGTFISFNNCADERFIDIHCAYLTACERSRNCKRFIASEFAGNIDDFPMHPRIYGTTRAPFRKVLQECTGIEWTLFNNGWFMDYFLPKDKTYMRPVPDEFPVDPNAWQACIKGTGDEPQSWTCCRDVGKAVVMLLHAPEWVGRDTMSNPSLTPPNIMLKRHSGAHHVCCWPVGYFQRGHQDRGILLWFVILSSSAAYQSLALIT